MATVAEPAPRPLEGERRLVLNAVGWDGYEALLGVLGDEHPGTRLTYDRGSVELVSASFPHERIRTRLGSMVWTIAEEFGLPCVALGSTTWKSQLLDRGLEADECFYLANAGRVRDMERVDLEVDPPPDLAIEVEITSPLLDKLGVYAALGIPEIWHYKGDNLRVLLLGPDGRYTVREASAAFPFLPMGEIARHLREHDPNNDTRWARAFRAWVRGLAG